jgi:hypothetical protein
MHIVALFVIILITLLIVVLPVQWAARLMGAKRTSFGMCFLALIGASILHGLGLLVPVAGSIVAFLLSALGYAGILETKYLQGVGIALLSLIFGAVIIGVLVGIAMVLGVSLTL